MNLLSIKMVDHQILILKWTVIGNETMNTYPCTHLQHGRTLLPTIG